LISFGVVGAFCIGGVGDDSDGGGGDV